MGEKENKNNVFVDKQPKKKDLIYLTLLVAVFMLFFFTFWQLDTVEERCFDRFDNAMQTLQTDPCMSQCINDIISYEMNYTLMYGGNTNET